jgi:hypothetical protein
LEEAATTLQNDDEVVVAKMVRCFPVCLELELITVLPEPLLPKKNIWLKLKFSYFVIIFAGRNRK